MMRISLFLVAALATAAHAGSDQTAQDHIARATAAHQEGKYEVALAELQAAYDLDPRPELLFAIAQVHAKLGQCAEAISFYEQFLATTKDRDTRAVVEEAITACKQQLAAAKPEPEPEPEPEPRPEPAPKPKPAPPPRRIAARPFDDAPRRDAPPRRTPWYTDKLGDTLVVGGVLALAGGALTYASARGELDDAEAAPDLATYEDRLDAARGKRTYAVILAGGGAALIGAGILRFAMRTPEASTRIGALPTHGGGVVTLWRRF